ncbi:ABC transporter ATP-binding protein [Actinoplanes sp. ATCC 53533]|uniref:ATP-binding cassette domain-containing protein n=1 Tax=Actinoplanes sp. ATCC 53533 TaxID=1288362 RepID=UPI000F774297|nr:ABC transporter ATP-binding protein [Actinoplanes sp. ATCC 53533]RSM58321.1 ABC transporter ATP-binding protein [Actinoplanes sp. ATCC 53533]
MVPAPPRRSTLVLLAAAGGISAVAELALPLAIGHTVDAVVADRAAGRWLAWSAVLVGVLVVADPVRDLVAGLAPAERTAYLRRCLVRHTLALGDRGAGGPGDAVSRMMTGAADAGQGGAAVVLAWISIVPVAGAVVALAYLDGWLITGYLAGSVAVAALLRRHVRDTSDAVVRYQRAQADIATRLSEALAGSRTIVAAATVPTEIRRCLRPLRDLAAAGVGTWHVLARSAAQGALAGPLLQLSVVAVGGWLLSRGRLTPGELLAAIQYGALGAGIGGLVASFNRVARARAGSRRVTEVLRRPVPRYGRRELPAGPGTLTFRGVTVRAAGVPVLSGVTLALPGGRPAAVVGRSGSGKSLLAALAARLVDPDEGQIRLDGVPLTELSADSLRREIGVAFEDPMLVGATVGDAVGLGQDRPDHATVAAALHAASAGTFVSRLPRGAGTPLADTPLSGGERQRLGLARAWHAGRLLVLDDATSSLDTATEAEIMGLVTGRSRRTHLVVAHRASTAARCATVVWLDGGRVRAVAPHRQLWTDPDYRAVFGAGDHP